TVGKPFLSRSSRAPLTAPPDAAIHHMLGDAADEFPPDTRHHPMKSNGSSGPILPVMFRPSS
ncbi:hypothetical protein, partial [Paracoccus marinaquae]